MRQKTNSLDEESESMIIEKLLDRKDITLILVSHNRRFQKKFNTTYNIKNLRLVKC